MTTKTKDTHASALAALQALIAGTQKHAPNGNFTLAGTAYTTATIIQVLTDLADALTARIATAASVKDAIAAVHDANTKYGTVVKAYRKCVLAAYSSAAILADYGLTAPKARKVLTAQEMVAKAAQNKATRIARGTLGPRKRLEIVGTVDKAPQATPAQPAAQETPALPAQPTAAHVPTEPAKPTAPLDHA
jgi:hypothetical protein